MLDVKGLLSSVLNARLNVESQEVLCLAVVDCFVSSRQLFGLS